MLEQLDMDFKQLSENRDSILADINLMFEEAERWYLEQ